MKVDQETALEEFKRMCETADITFETHGLDEEEAKDLQGNVDFFVEKISLGEISVTGEGLAVMHLANDKELQFRVPEGKEIMIVAGAPEAKRMKALVDLTAALTGTDPRYIGKLRKREWKLAVRLAGFLSAD